MKIERIAPVNPDVSIFVEEWGVKRFFYRDSSGRVVDVGTHV